MPANLVGAAHDLGRRLTVLILFGILFGYVEAAAVVYIRVMYEPIHQRLFPERDRDDLFPLFTLEQWAREGPAYAPPLMEVLRELGTVLMTVLVAFGVSRGFQQGFASFVLSFGVADVTYYLFLKALIGWPHSLSNWDLIFAAPLPWVGPVWAPLLVAAAMIATAGLFFYCEATSRPMKPKAGHWAAVLLGGLMIIFAFWWDCRNMMTNGVPENFNGQLLLAGLFIGLLGFCHAQVTTGTPAE